MITENKNMQKSKRRGKTFQQQEKYYEVPDFKDFIINRWILGIDIFPYYKELNLQCRYELIEWLLHYTPHRDWTKIALYLLNPKNK